MQFLQFLWVDALQSHQQTKDTQQLFDNLKEQFTEEPILMMPNHNRPFQIKSNTFKWLQALKDDIKYMTKNYLE